MLVKILSFIASVLSNARYKAVLVPCIILVLSITSLTAVALVHDSGSHSAASTAGTKEPAQEKQPTASPQINGSQQPTKDSTSSPVADSQTGAGSGAADGGNVPSQATKPAPTAADVTLSTAGITVEPNGTSSVITASASDNNPLTWSITPETNDVAGLQLVAEKAKDATASYSFRFRASQNAVAGQYPFTLTAKDASRNINISKTITITVTP